METAVSVVVAHTVQPGSMNIRILVADVFFVVQLHLEVAARIVHWVSIGMKLAQVDVVIVDQQVTVAGVHTVRQEGTSIDVLL